MKHEVHLYITVTVPHLSHDIPCVSLCMILRSCTKGGCKLLALTAHFQLLQNFPTCKPKRLYNDVLFNIHFSFIPLTYSYFCGFFNDTLSIRAIQCQMVECVKNWKGFGRKQSWPSSGSILVLSRRD
jgi:hypothetical protein